MIKSIEYFHSSISDLDLLTDANRKEEVIKMLLHTLDQMGYKKTFEKLSVESNIKIEVGPLAQIESQSLAGEWEEILKFVEGADMDKEKVKKICFLVNEQRYIELIVNQQYNEALLLLRGGLVQSGEDSERLSKLAAILMCSNVNEIEEKLGIKLDIPESRRKVCKEIKKELGSKDFTAGSRLHKLIHQAISFQHSSCKYHEEKDHHDNMGLIEDHSCRIEQFPTKAYLGFREQFDDVCIVKFSNKGDLIATATRGKELCIWELKMQNMTPKLKHRVSKIHERRISCLNWSPNDKKLLTASFDQKVKIWDVETGTLKIVLQSHQDIVCTAAWIPGSQNFISAGLDNYMVLWNSQGEEVSRINSCKIAQLLVSSDGRKLYLVSALHPKIIVVDTITQTEINWIPESGLVCAAILSKDDKFLLTQLPHPISELHLWDLEKQKVIQVFPTNTKEIDKLGFSFGGANDQFIACGTEQGGIKIWHRSHTEPVATLKTHTALVNSISWHPQTSHLLISSSEDHSTCIWVSEYLESVFKNGEIDGMRDGEITDVKENERILRI